MNFAVALALPPKLKLKTLFNEFVSGREHLVIYLLLSLVLAVKAWPDVAVVFRDTDDATRLAEVKDLLAGQGWFDLRQLRFDPGVDVASHWSRVIDLPLAALIAIFSSVVSEPIAIKLAMIAFPLGLLLLIASAVQRIADATAASSQQVVAVGLLATSNILAEYLPGRIDHHGFQIMCAAWLLAHMLEGRGLRSGILAGLVSALGLTVGIEALVVIAGGAAWYAALFIADEKHGRVAAGYGLALAVAALLLQIAFSGPHAFEPACDRLGGNFLAAILAGGTGLAIAHLINDRCAFSTLWARAALVAVVAGASLGLFVSIDAACLAGPFGHVDPRLGPIWLNRVMEMQPLSTLVRVQPSMATAFLPAVPLGLAGLVVVVRRRIYLAQPVLVLLAVVLLATILMAAMHIRATTYAILSSIPFALIFIDWCAQKFAIPGHIRPSLAGLLVLGFGVGITLAVRVLTADSQAADSALNHGVATKPPSCFDTRAYELLGELSPGLVVAHTYLAPFIIISTPHSALAAPYHRLGHGIIAAHDILNSPPTESRALIRRYGASYVVLCDKYPAFGPAAEGLESQLRAGTVPAWLTALPGPGPLHVFRVTAE